ncbi:major facilitator superfamily domain-containing protein [Aspergillus pseudotamarii]|uniref:Major facilitator superfamily domain-containing protein n=1 Tax=Aspergillus pseudotamarii TaxID=132259 RepID=A0A5N6SB70_ASPPS|nr:major facilitator superfamily domain-containing protein [Aspergillus pseudotamarii]KAE8131962.1 major facilitator superfamily domain-containing protein [Aspergillus pseudotamarii]
MATQPSGGPDSSAEPSPESSLECLGSFVEKENARVKVESRDIEAGELSQDELDNIVHWDGPDDPRNPMNWSDARKWLIIGLISLSSFNTSLVSTIFAPGVPEVLKEFHTDNSSLASLMVSIYVMGSAVGPLVLTPITEMSGRLPVTHGANIVFMIAAIVCASSINISMLIVSRLIMGIASSVPVTVGGGFVADMMPMERRGTAMTIWTVGPLLGFVIGPIFGGYMVENVGWRWTVWLEAIQGGFIVIASLVFLRETYAPTILRREAMRLQKATGQQYHTKFDSESTAGQMLLTSLTRPIKFLFLSPIVLIVSLYSAVTYSYMYVLFTTFTDVFENVYGFSPGQAGLGYLGLGMGFCVGQITIGYYSDRHVKKQEKIHGKMKPEHRLPPLVLGCFLVPIGLFWYGWSAQYRLHWIVPIIGTFFIGAGIFYVHLVTQVYLVDSYTLYAASAVSAELALRCVFGATIPLAGTPLYDTLGLGWGNTLLGFIALAFAPTSFFLLKYGESIRTNPKFMPKMT